MEKTLLKLVLIGGLALTTLFLSPAAAQEFKLNPPRKLQEKSLNPATSNNPVRLRNMLLAIHGFTRIRLDAASTDVPAILQGFIDSPSESITVKRQAIKALKLYPTGENLAFIEGRINSSPLGLQRLYISSLAGFIGNNEDQVANLLIPLVGNPDITIRQVAVGVAGILQLNTPLRSALEKRLDIETESSFRRAINRALAPR